MTQEWKLEKAGILFETNEAQFRRGKLCDGIQENIAYLRDQITALTDLRQEKENYLSDLRGELAVEENTLDKIVDRIRDISASAVDCAVSRSLSGCVGAIVSLTNSESVAERRIANLNQRINRTRNELQITERQLGDRQNELRQRHQNYSASNCSDFF